MERSRGNVSEEEFRQVIDQIADEKPFLNFWGWGEPLLHPEIFP